MRRLTKNLAIVVAALGLWLVAGCETTDSENVKTSGIWAKFQVDDNGDGTVTAWALLRVVPRERWSIFPVVSMSSAMVLH